MRRPIVINADLRSNYHTHSILCDGKDSLREMTEQAVSLGFTELGFSGHQWSEHDQDYAMTPENTAHYLEELAELREEFAPKIGIFTGIERGYVSPDRDNSRFDYVIASVHNAGADGCLFAVGSRHICGHDGHHRLSAAHVSLQEPVHLPAGSHVLQDILESPYLSSGELEIQ